jgi:curved DNA-binding protein CbpA
MERALRYDHYKVLGVPRDATEREIKRAYRERVKLWHPDRNGSDRAAEVFHALHEAYSTLMDAGARAAYDDRLRHYREAGKAAPDATQAHRDAWARHMARAPERPASPADRALFRGLHATGLVFAVLLIGGILFGCAALGWPTYTLFLLLPGLVVLPDSIAGLRAK